jgi:predicted nucleic acid-binding protein
LKAAFDTSVLVAAVVADHPRHDVAIAWLRSRRRVQRFASCHAMAETWSVLTRLPLDVPISGDVARRVVERLATKIDMVAPSAALYAAALDRCARLGARSGAVFDALHLLTAEGKKADVLLTFNERDFARLATDASPRIVVPSASEAP